MENSNVVSNLKKQGINGASLSQSRMVVDRALLLMEHGYCEEADLLVSAELLFTSGDAQLWLLAGLARYQKGNFRTAVAAFRMSAWLDGNALAKEMIDGLEKQ